MTVEDIVRALDLQPHPEGGYYRQTFRATLSLEGLPHGAPRAASTAIYYLLRDGEEAKAHRVKSDEVWHYYAGAPLELLVGDQKLILGPDVLAGQQPQIVVPAHVAQSARASRGWVLCGCTVAPGFDFADWELL